jgi:hypothetical protein
MLQPALTDNTLGFTSGLLATTEGRLSIRNQLSSLLTKKQKIDGNFTDCFVEFHDWLGRKYDEAVYRSIHKLNVFG